MVCTETKCSKDQWKYRQINRWNMTFSQRCMMTSLWNLIPCSLVATYQQVPLNICHYVPNYTAIIYQKIIILTGEWTMAFSPCIRREINQGSWDNGWNMLHLGGGGCGAQVKEKLSLYISLRHIWEREVQLHSFLTSTLGGSEMSSSFPGWSTPPERVPSTHWIGNWVVPRSNLDVSCCHQVSNHNSLAVQSVAYQYTAYVIPAHFNMNTLL